MTTRRAGLAFALSVAALGPTELAGGPAQAWQTPTEAAFPAVDDIVRAAVPRWKQIQAEVDVKVVSRQFADHHAAMTTSLPTSVHLPDVMALEVGCVGRFAQGGGLEDLALEPFGIARFRSRVVPYAYDQATARSEGVVAAPADIGPGTLLYRADVVARAGVDEAELTRSWGSYVAAGVRIKAATGAYLMPHARDMKDIVIRTGIQPGEGLYFDHPSRVLVTSPRFVRAFELARHVRRYRLDVTLDQVEAMTMGDRIAVFHQGGVEQLASPMALYNRPVNEFVAGFLGAPRINLVDRATAGAPLPHQALWQALAGSAPAGVQRAGLRPEHLRVVPHGEGLAATVVLAEHLGDSSSLHIRVDGVDGLLNAKIGANHGPVVTGQAVGLLPDPAWALHFDATGRRVS